MPSLKKPLKRPDLRYSRMHDRLGVFWPITAGSIALALIFATAVTFYMTYEGWDFWDSFYMTVITLSSVGFQEVRPLSQEARIFTSFLIFGGVGSFAFLAGSAAQLLVEGRINQILGRRRVQKAIDRLENHFIICGYGRIGSIVAREIMREGHPLVVIEQDPDIVKKLEADNILHLVGDATSDQLLLAAGLTRAKSLITALTQEAANVYVVLTARQLNPEIIIVSRADHESHISRLERAGADRVVLPHTIGGVRMAQSVLRPSVVNFIDMAVQGGLDLQMEELSISSGSSLVGKNLIESQIRPRFNLIIIGIKHADGEMHFNPSPDAVIKAGDSLLCIGKPEHFEQIQEIL
ncbi:potassium channel family protein [Megalodesulfovibrio paquesii]